MKKKYVCGIDIGGTNTVVALVDEQGVIPARRSMPTAGETVEAYAAKIGELIEEILADAGVRREEVSGIGICAPCADYRTGMIEAATNLPWPMPIALRDIVSKATGMAVAVSNDANAAAVGEMRYGAARGMKDFIVLTLGTGVGSGIVCDGHLLTGHRGFAGELGHSSVRGGEGRKCGCGRTDCLETYCAAPGVVATATAVMRRRGMEVPAELTAKMVGEAADRGEEWAVEALEYTGSVIGRACADFVTFSDPEAIILFGGVANAFRHFEPAMRKALEEHTLFLYRNRVKILATGLKATYAAVLGAAALAW